ncbi:FCD domain protein [Mycobacterium xenopi 3993]|nr:FCD domain protein [Mycobacterium xenopi 3993]
MLPLTRQDIHDIFWLQATIATELAATATDLITDAEIDELEHLNEELAAAVGSGDTEAIASAEFAFHRVFNQASGRIKLAFFCCMPRATCRHWSTPPTPTGVLPR